MKNTNKKHGYILYHKRYKRIMTIENKKNYTNWNNKDIIIIKENVELAAYNVSDNAKVSGNAWVSGDARVFGNAEEMRN